MTLRAAPQAYELSTLTGTQVLLLVASETGHVYTFATRKLQPMITSETGKALIQTCLNSPDSPPRSDPTTDQRMSATGFEETDLTYQVSESDSSGETKVRPRWGLGSLLRRSAPGRLWAPLSLPGRLHALALIDKNLILPPWPYKAWFPSPESLAGPLTFLISCSCLLLWCCFGRGQGGHGEWKHLAGPSVPALCLAARCWEAPGQGSSSTGSSGWAHRCSEMCRDQGLCCSSLGPVGCCELCCTRSNGMNSSILLFHLALLCVCMPALSCGGYSVCSRMQ